MAKKRKKTLMQQLQECVGQNSKGAVDISQAQVNECVRYTLAFIVNHITSKGLNGYADICKMLYEAEKRERKRKLKQDRASLLLTPAKQGN